MSAGLAGVAFGTLKVSRRPRRGGFGPGTEVAEPHKAACGCNAAFGRPLAHVLLGRLDAPATSTEHTTCPVRRSSSGRPLRHVGRLANAPQVLPLRGSRSASATLRARLAPKPSVFGSATHSGRLVRERRRRDRLQQRGGGGHLQVDRQRRVRVGPERGRPVDVGLSGGRPSRTQVAHDLCGSP